MASESTIRVTVSDESGTVLDSREVQLAPLVDAVRRVGLKRGQIQAAKALVEVGDELGEMVASELRAAICRALDKDCT